ncbi:MAG: START domain-containing protein [Pseudomonadota bacterium]
MTRTVRDGLKSIAVALIALTALFPIALATVARAEIDTHALAQSLEWKLRRDEDGIRVFTADVPDSKHAAVRSEMHVATPLRELVALVLDTSACSSWAALCKESTIPQRSSDTEFHVYTYNDLPWPVKDRDAVTRVVWTVNPESGSAHMVAELTEGLVKAKGKALRLTTGVTSWTFTPTENGTLVENFAHIDPGGSMPAWVTNMLLVDSPHDTLVAMRETVAKGAYADAKVSFLP